MNETSLKSSYNKVPQRMKRIMLKFFANLGRVFDRREQVMSVCHSLHVYSSSVRCFVLNEITTKSV